MAKGPYVTEKTRGLIADIFLENPKLKTREIHEKVRNIIGSNTPGESATQKEITKLRRKLTEMPPSKLDKRWNIGCLGKYYFPPESIPILIEGQRITLQSKHEEIRNTFTIRLAQWIVRLHTLILEIYLRKYNEQLDAVSRRPVNTGYLWIVSAIAGIYAHLEIASEILGIDYLDTSDIDNQCLVNELFWSLRDKDKPGLPDIARQVIYRHAYEVFSDPSKKKSNRGDKAINK